MIVQIVCDATMFLVFLIITAFTMYHLIILPKRLKNISEEDSHLSQIEISQKCQKLYTRRCFVLLLIHVCALVVDGILCILDGLSDTENGLIIPVWVFLSFSLTFIIFFAIYSEILRKKYQMITSNANNSLGNWRTNCPVDLMVGIMISFAFAFNSSIVAYTIGLLI